ncbi:hypothetical protein ACQ5SO_17680 [Rhodovulum sp. DZ06]|uniref:hypothetical protein n=1 Tax=Rhodovulum sp. DZ06 TaxID=3425126 RepID=UPI003D34B294
MTDAASGTDLSALIALWTALNASMLQVWAMIAAGAFAACAFAVTHRRLGAAADAAMTLGYALFAMGMGALLRHDLVILAELKAAHFPGEPLLAPILHHGADYRWSLAAHGLVSLCVVAIIWREAIAARLGPRRAAPSPE